LFFGQKSTKTSLKSHTQVYWVRAKKPKQKAEPALFWLAKAEADRLGFGLDP
jgi:hypothetical protein